MRNIALLTVMEFFLENPYEEFYLRQLAKRLKLSPFAIKKYADLLIKEEVIAEERKANLRYFKANTSNLFFRHLKITFNIRSIMQCGLLDFLEQNLANVSAIVLFGSLAKGENDRNSDVDILVIGKERRLRLEEFEEKTGREITLHVFSWSEWNAKAKQDKAFYAEIISHGIPLYGELPIVR